MLPLYTDDALNITVNKSGMRNQLNIERSFQKIKDFLNMNGLQINVGKTTLTKFMCHQKRSKLRGIPMELTVEETIEGRVQDKHILDNRTCRTLGANLKNDMTWEVHLLTGKKPVLPGIRRQLGVLHKLGRHLSLKDRLQLTNAMILSRLTYLIALWGNTNESMVLKAQRVKNCAARFVTGLRKSTRVSTLL